MILEYITIALLSIISIELVLIIWKLYHSILINNCSSSEIELTKQNKKLTEKNEHLTANTANQKKQYHDNVKKFKQSIKDLKKENKKLREGCPDNADKIRKYKNEITYLHQAVCNRNKMISELEEQLKK